jgi:hypothetical protein
VSDGIKKTPGLDAAKREQWARKALHGIELRTKRFGEFVGAVRELIATLPKCETYLPGFDGDRCGRPATRYEWPTGGREPGDVNEREHYCDEHGRMQSAWQSVQELDYAAPLRKLQAMLDPEETAAPACTPREVRKALEGDGVQSVRVTDDGMGGRLAEVDMGLAGRVTVRIDASDTTASLVAKIRLAFWKPRIPCPRCGAREEPEESTIGPLDGSIALRCAPCGMTWRTKST